jgi:ABC-2 type transport system ATP-binding protein
LITGTNFSAFAAGRRPASVAGVAPRVEVRGLTKHFGSVVAVDDLTFSVEPGMVTGFLGPNGAGKTTTFRMLLGLVSPTSGRALVNRVAYRDLPDPTRAVGAVLEASGFHPARTARNHLRSVAAVAGIDFARVDEVLELVGLGADAKRTVGGYSLGMRQRLELARALLGDPEVLILDEPANGLDPQGIAWIRGFLRWFASSGKVVFVSSHLLAEAAQTVDDVVILASGRLVGHGPLQQLLQGVTTTVRVRTPDAARLMSVLQARGPEAGRVRLEGRDTVVADGTKPEVVGPVIAENRIVVHEMTSTGESLEQLFFQMTEGGQMGGHPIGQPFGSVGADGYTPLPSQEGSQEGESS